MEGTNGNNEINKGRRPEGAQKRNNKEHDDDSYHEKKDASFRDLVNPETYQKWLQINDSSVDYQGNDKDKVMECVNRAGEFALFWQKIAPRYYSESEKETVAAMFIPDQFVKFANKKADIIAAKYGISPDALKNPENEQLCFQISEEIRRDMVLNYGNLFRQIDEKHANEFFDEIVKQDMWKGIDVAVRDLGTGISQLGRYFETNKVDDFKFNFVKRTSKALDEEKAMKSGQLNAFQRIRPESAAEPIDADEFVKKIGLFGDHEYNLRQYLHNVRALSLAGPGRDPYFTRMKQFADKLSTVDLDEITMLPDYDITSTALQLHSKLVQEELAKNDWKHTATMFLREKGEMYTKIERETMRQLEMIFQSEFANSRINNEVNSEKKDNWRLRRAFDMAMGLTRGVFMNEMEYAASADPSLKLDGSPNYLSYYTTDPTALCAFDPKHLLLRYQSEGMIMGPMLFTPVKGEKKGTWDHMDMMKRMDQYFKAFIEGRNGVDPKFRDEVLFIDTLQNIGDIGGLPKRGGYRWEQGVQGWYKDNAPENGMSHLENIKQVENIGYEILGYYLNSQVKDEFLEGKNFNTKENDPVIEAKRNEFFQYLFSTYIKPTTQESQDYNQYYQSIRSRFPGDKEAYKYIIERSQIGCLYNRFPSFLIKNERNRYTKDGKRSWHVLRDESGLGNEGFDLAMKNLGLAETMLRLETSREMEKMMLSEGGLSIGDKKYEINEESIRRLLTGKVNSAAEVENVVSLYTKIKGNYLTDKKFDEEYKKKYLGDDKEYRYTVGIEELDARFISFRAAGGTIIPRIVNDIAKVENDVVGNIGEMFKSFHSVAIDSKHDFSPILEAIGKMKTTYEGIHGPEKAEKIAYNFIKVAVTYFRKDDIARPWLGLAGVMRKNSIAAEFLGKTHDVWEWDAIDIDRFLVAIENKRILRKEPLAYGGGLDLNKVMEKEPLKIFGMKTGFSFNKLKPSHKDNYSQKMREDVGATYKHVIYDLMNKYGFAAVAFLLYSWMSKAFQENFGKKEKYS